jgi:large subunit ribosomal protein L22
MSTARLTNYRQSPRKVRLLADLVRGKSVERALLEIEHAGKRAGTPIAKLIRSAVANAEQSGAKVADLVVFDIRVDEGTVMKRMMPRARGSAFQILKRTSHVVVALKEKTEAAKGKDLKDTKETNTSVVKAKAKSTK